MNVKHKMVNVALEVDRHTDWAVPWKELSGRVYLKPFVH